MAVPAVVARWVKSEDELAIGVGDHDIGNRKYWIRQTEKDSFRNKHFCPAIGENCNEAESQSQAQTH